MGAVYQAAVLSKAFKVTPFLVRDAAVFPIQVSRDYSSIHAAGERLNILTSENFTHFHM